MGHFIFNLLVKEKAYTISDVGENLVSVSFFKIFVDICQHSNWQVK